MKFGIVVVLAVVLVAFGAHFLAADPGYVVMGIRGYRLEMSVPVLLGFAVLLIAGLALLRWIWLTPRRIGEAAGRYRAGRAGQKLTQGMIEVAEGNFARGEKLLARSAKTSDTPLFNFLLAARAAHLQGRDDRRDDWLKLAYEQTPEASNAVLLTQAELQLDREQYEEALATLRRLDEDSHDHGYALALLGRLYYRLQDWNSLGELLGRIEKKGNVKADTLKTWSIRVHREKLDKAIDSTSIAAAWKNVPKSQAGDLALQTAYYRALMRVGLHEQAEKELAKTLKSDWRGPLVQLYGQIEGPDPSRQLKRAEGWLAEHGDDPDLLVTAARLCLKNELWGKARSYLETVLGMRPTPEAYQLYGELLLKLGESEAAAKAYQSGLGLNTDSSRLAIPDLRRDSGRRGLQGSDPKGSDPSAA